MAALTGLFGIGLSGAQIHFHRLIGTVFSLKAATSSDSWDCSAPGGMRNSSLSLGTTSSIGRQRRSQTVIASFQRHAAILGSTGSGKSCAVSLILERAHARKYANLVVFDIHGEYASLAKPPAAHGKTAPAAIACAYKIAGPGDLDSPPENAISLPYWLLSREEMLSMILDRSDQNAPNQASRFTLHVRDLKGEMLEKEGKVDVRATFTVDSPIPYALDELLAKLKHDDIAKKKSASTGKDVKGDWEGKLTRFLSRLEAKVSDRRYGFMFKPPAPALQYDWLAEQMAKLLAAPEGKCGIRSSISQRFLQTYFQLLRAYSHGCYTMCSSGWKPKNERRLCSCVTKPISTFLYARMRTQSRNRLSTPSNASRRKDANMASLCWW